MSASLVAAESAAADVAVAAASDTGPDFGREGGPGSIGDSDMLDGASTDGKEENVDADGKPKANSRARDVRLDQNRKAARESRRRKKVMIEELQRSVIFFSRANSTLKQQNDELTRMILQAQTMVAQMNDDAKVEEGAKSGGGGGDGSESASMFKAPPSAAAANNNKNSNIPVFTSLPPMQPGATMQAMSNFQQAASVAMQQAMQGLQSIPGINLNQITAAPAGASAQQAYTDTMTALAMQQAAMAAAAGHTFNLQQGFPQAYNPFMWQASAQQMMQSQQQQNETPSEPAQEPSEGDDKQE